MQITYTMIASVGVELVSDKELTDEELEVAGKKLFLARLDNLPLEDIAVEVIDEVLD
jgi:hypothetical protein